MSDNECKSEVARFRKLLELECEAMKLGFSGFAMTARHDIIHNRYKNLGTHEKELAKHIGEEKAHEVMIDTYIKVMG